MPAPTPPSWATSVNADVVEPDAQKKSIGWVADDVPPHEWFNWFWNAVSVALAWLLSKNGSGQFDTVGELIDEIADDELGTVVGADVEGWVNDWSYVHPATVLRILADGRFVFAATATSLYAHDATDGSLVWSLAGVFTGVVDIACDGAFVYVYDTGAPPTIYQFNALTGATVNTRTDAFAGANAVPLAIESDGERVYWTHNGGVAASYNSVHYFSLAAGWAGAVSTIVLGEEPVDLIVADGGRFILPLVFAHNSMSFAIGDADAGTSFAANMAVDGQCAGWDGDAVFFGLADRTLFSSVSQAMSGITLVNPDPTSDALAPDRVAINTRWIVRLVNGAPHLIDIRRNPRGQGRPDGAAVDAGILPLVKLGSNDAVNDVALDADRLYYAGAPQTAFGTNPTLVSHMVPSKPTTYRKIASTNSSARRGNIGLVVMED